MWTTDENEQRECIERIEAGQLFINSPVASDPRIPFGGVKRSGYGRELSAFGIREFVNIKTVWIKCEAAHIGKKRHHIETDGVIRRGTPENQNTLTSRTRLHVES